MKVKQPPPFVIERVICMKEKYTLAIGIEQAERRIREQAANILHCKEIGISEKAVQTMIEWLRIDKMYLDDMKRQERERRGCGK